MGLLRFNPGSDNIWVAHCAPDHFILPSLAEHFTARFGDDPWAIIDEKRGLALVRQKGEDCSFGPLSLFPFLAAGVQEQDNWEDLWRHYHQAIIIENRKNPGLQRQLMPARYWKYLPEKQ
jgi:probable DNA metabolism protein